MKHTLLTLFLVIGFSGHSQTVLQTMNSGSVIGTAGSISVGEIVVIPQNATQPQSGIIGILAQVNQQTLEVPSYQLDENVTVFPNPTTEGITFSTKLFLSSEKVSIYNLSGQLVSKKQVSAENTIGLAELPVGVYLIQFENKNIPSFKIVKR